MASNEKYTVLYGRLSQEDTQKTNKTDDSNSIQNQKLLLEKYAAEKGFTNTLFLYDDGYSGTNFQPPRLAACHGADGKRSGGNTDRQGHVPIGP